MDFRSLVFLQIFDQFFHIIFSCAYIICQMVIHPIYYIPVANCTKKFEQQGSYSDIIEAVDKILDTFPDKTIIHTVSNSRANQLRDTSRHPIEIYNASDGKVNLGLFREGSIRVLASPSIERGFDFPDDNCRFQIMGKVPFPNTADPITKARSQEDRNFSSRLASISLAQSYGRGVRSDTDWCECFVIDDNIVWFIRKNRALFPGWFLEAYVDRKVTEIPKPLCV